MLERPRARPRLRKRTWAIAFATLVLAGGIGTWVYLGQTVTWRLQAAQEEADRLDPGWRLRDLLAARAMIPDEENSAIRVARVRRLLPNAWLLYARGVNRRPPPGVPAPLDLMSLATELPRNERLGLSLAAELRDAVEKYPEATRLARGLLGMPRGRYALKIEPNVIMTLLDEQQGSRNVVRFLQTDAFVRAEMGDLDGSLESCRAVIHCGRALGDEPFAISQLIRIAIVSVAIDTSRRVLAQGEPSDEALRIFQEALAEESRHSYLRTSFRGERAGMDDLFSKLATGEADVRSLASGTSLGPISFLPMGATFYRYNRALFLEELNEAVEISRGPDERLLKDWADWDERHRPPTNMFAQFPGMLKHLLTPAMTAIVQAHVRARSQQATAIVAIAAERQRRATGRFPESVAAIEARFLPVPAVDPYDGRPLRMRTTGDGIAIYSVGPDLRDDGGQFDVRQRPISGTDQGTLLYRTELRGLASPRELPDDVFQRTPDAPREEDEPV